MWRVVFEVIIKTDYSRLSDLSAKLKRIENDIAEITLRVTKMANTTAQTTRYQNTQWEIKRACDLVANAVNNTNKRMRIVCEKLNNQSIIVRGSISSYRDADKIQKINKGNVLSKVGPNLAGIFGTVDVKRSYLGVLSSNIINGTKNV